MGLLYVDKDVLFFIVNDFIVFIDLIKINDILVNFNGFIFSFIGLILMKKYMYVYIEKNWLCGEIYFIFVDGSK